MNQVKLKPPFLRSFCSCTCYSMSKEDWKFMHIFQTLTHVMICRAISPAWSAVCCQSHLWFHPSPCVPCSKAIPSKDVQKHSRTTSNELAQKWAENQKQRKIDHISTCLFTSWMVLVGSFRFNPCWFNGLKRRNRAQFDSAQGQFENVSTRSRFLLPCRLVSWCCFWSVHAYKSP